MVIGEGPGETEQSLGRPFVGASGRLLDKLLEAAGLDRTKVWVTNATLGLPPRRDAASAKKNLAFHERFPQAVYSCLPRLEAEIAAAQPRVIVTLGQAALIALTGYEVARKRTIRVQCENVDCDAETRKLRTLCLVCASADCDWYAGVGFPVPPDGDPALVGQYNVDTAAGAEVVKQQHAGKCPKCAANISRLKPRQMKCPTCKGRKTRIEDYVSFEYQYKLVGRGSAAGAVIPADDASSQLGEFGVKYIIPTYHPSYCLHPAKKKGSGEDRVIGGQYAARVCVEHLEKARRLLREDPIYRASDRVVSTVAEFEEFTRDASQTYYLDLEWNSMDGPWTATKITLFGVGTQENEVAITIDGRKFPTSPNFAPHPLLDAIHRFLLDPTKKKVFHNGQADRIVLANVWGMDEVLGVTSDTIISYHALYPDEELNLGFCAHAMLDAPHWKVPQRKLKYGERDDLVGYRTFEELSLYNARDTRSTALIDRVMNGPPGGRGRLDTERVRAVHDIDVRMQEISIRMELAGLPLDRAKLAETQKRCEDICAEELKEMRQVVGVPTWMPSGKELLWALFGAEGPLRLEPFSYTPTGQPSLEKESLARMTDQHPFIGRLMRYKKYAYVLTNYVHGEALRVQRDGRIHPQWKVYGTTTGRWTSSPNCFSADTEILTPRGWVLFPALLASDQVAQWSEQEGISWVRPLARQRVRHRGSLLRIETAEQIRLLVTDDHRCLVRDRKTKKYKVVAARDYPSDHQQLHCAPAAGGSLHLSEAQIALLCAVQADGSFTSGAQIKFNFAKRRKQKRLRWALDALQANYWTAPCKSGTQRVFTMNASPLVEWVKKMLPGKCFASWVLDLTKASRTCFCAEVFLWDGWAKGASMYASNQKSNADLVQAALVLEGSRRTKLRVYYSKRGANPSYQLDVSSCGRVHSMTTNVEKTKVPYDGYVYCVSVPSSFVVVRREGRVAITGNCQNWGKGDGTAKNEASNLRGLVVAPPGRRLVGADYAALELRIMADLSGDEGLITRLVNSDEGDKLNPEKDLHAYVAGKTFGNVYINGTKEEKKVLRDIEKCVDPDTLIFTPDGPTTLRALVPDLGKALSVGLVAQGRVASGTKAIADGSGHLVRPTAWYVTGERDCLYVTTRRAILTCSRDHKLLLVDGTKRRAEECAGLELAPPTVPLLEEGEYPEVLLPGGALRGMPTVHIPLSHDWAYLAGVFLGDGTAAGHGIKISHGELGKVDELGVPYTEWQASLYASARVVGFDPKRRKRALSLGDRSTSRVFGALGLTDTPLAVGSGTRIRQRKILRIPQWVLSAGRSAVLHCLAGLVDTDGCVSARDGAISVCSKDAVFAGQVATLFHALGVTPRIDPCWNEDYQRYYWTVAIGPKHSRDLFSGFLRHPGKLRRLRPSGEHIGSTLREGGNVVKLLEPAGLRYCADLEVNSSDHVYLQSGIVGSNSIIYGANYGAGAETILEGIYSKGYDGPPITLQIVGAVLATIKREFPRISVWREAQVRSAHETRELRSMLLGRRRIFPLGDIDTTICYNFGIQASAADVMNTRLAILAQVHDAIYLEIDEDRTDAVKKVVSDSLTCELSLGGGPKMLYLASADDAASWDKC
jgi:uracil-DNA glycosylase family 4